ncbi:MAG: hypothetical protein M3Z41_06250, partial [Candidatus Eremiobacteraeota bacterium]|nr:hypothetical protein [Candidatus Eremiobacteraeota bacterium]
LVQSGEGQRMRQCHTEYFLGLARKADESWNTTPTNAWLAALKPELDNFRSALEWALADRPNVGLGIALAAALGHLWSDSGLYPEGRHWVNAAIAALADGDRSAVAARLWLALATISDARVLHDAADKARALYEELGDQRGTAAALNWLSYGLYHMGQLDDAEKASNESFAILRESRHTKDYVYCLNRRAIVVWAKGGPDAGIQIALEGLSLAKSLGDEIMRVGLLSNLAEYEFMAGDARQALAHATEAAALSKRINDPRGMAIAYSNMAGYNRALDQMTDARAAALEAIHWARETQRPMIIAGAIESLALVEAHGHDPRRAAQLLGYVDATSAKLGSQREPNEARAYVQAMGSLQQRLQESVSSLLAEGAMLSEDQAIEEALKA